MSTILQLSSFLHSYQFPAKSEPVWASQVERWTQLDAASFGLADAFTHFRERFSTPPTTVFLGSPTASNTTDLHFASSGARSPAKFVHTLPNIRSAVLLKLSGWEGPMYCLQRDPYTVATAIAEGADLLRSGSPGPVWIASVFEATSQVWLGILENKPSGGDFSLHFASAPAKNAMATDEQLLSRFSPEKTLTETQHAPRLFLAPRWEIVKSPHGRGSF